MSKVFFLFWTGCYPIGMDDVTADFYLGIGSQEKGCRRSIRDEVST